MRCNLRLTASFFPEMVHFDLSHMLVGDSPAPLTPCRVIAQGCRHLLRNAVLLGNVEDLYRSRHRPRCCGVYQGWETSSQGWADASPGLQSLTGLTAP